MVSITTILLAIAGSFALASAADNPDKPTMNPEMNFTRVSEGTKQVLKYQEAKWTFWNKGWIPKACKGFAEGEGLNVTDVLVFDVKYKDCDDTWTFCRHKDAQSTELDMVNEFGRMPVSMRSYVR
jgi:hypothetical protein